MGAVLTWLGFFPHPRILVELPLVELGSGIESMGLQKTSEIIRSNYRHPHHTHRNRIVEAEDFQDHRVQCQPIPPSPCPQQDQGSVRVGKDLQDQVWPQPIPTVPLSLSRIIRVGKDL